MENGAGEKPKLLGFRKVVSQTVSPDILNVMAAFNLEFISAKYNFHNTILMLGV